MPIEPRSTLHLGGRERPRHVPHGAKPAALERVLDRLDGEGVLGAEEVLPPRGQLASPRLARDEFLGVEGGEDGGHDALEDLEHLEEAGTPEEKVERGGPRRLGGGRPCQMGDEVRVGCRKEGQEDGDEGEGRGEREREVDAVDVFVAARGQYSAKVVWVTLGLCLHGNAHQGQDHLGTTRSAKYTFGRPNLLTTGNTKAINAMLDTSRSKLGEPDLWLWLKSTEY